LKTWRINEVFGPKVIHPECAMSTNNPHAVCGSSMLAGLRKSFEVSYKDTASAFADIQLESASVIGVETDFLWPVHQQKEIVEMFSSNGVDSSFELLPSIQGLDSFLVDYDRFCPVVEEYFKTIS
jgi:homoserine acetyltransferase